MAFTVEVSLLERAARRERCALDALVSIVVPHIRYQLLRYPVATEDRHDLLQSTIIQVMTCIGSFRGESSFATWVYRVAANEALMLMRAQRRREARIVEGVDREELERLPAAKEASTSRSADFAASDRVRIEVVRGAIEQLPARFRAVVELYYDEDLALQEIADRLSLTESAVRSRLYRARNRLRKVLVRSPVVAEGLGDGARHVAARDLGVAAAA